MVKKKTRVLNLECPIKSLHDNQKQDFAQQENEVRGNWSSRFDFLIFSLSVVINITSIYSFPYYCYKYNGVAFILVYAILSCVIGLPILFLETSLGQYTSYGLLKCWDFAPVLKSVGISMLCLLVLNLITYTILLSWSLWLFVYTIIFEPYWAKCDQEWNTPNCSRLVLYDISRNCLNETIQTKYNTTVDLQSGYCIGSRNLTFGSVTKEFENVPFGIYKKNDSANVEDTFVLSIEEFIMKNMLKAEGYSIDKFGTVQWSLIVSVIVVWIIIFIGMLPKIKVYGKITYITFALKISLLIALLVKSITDKNSQIGLKTLFNFDAQLLLHANIWTNAMFELFFSLSLTNGILITLSSYNRFHNNILKDSFILIVINFLINLSCSVIVFAFLGNPIKESIIFKDFANVRPGLDMLFLIIPHSLTFVSNPKNWTIVFFLFVFLLGFDYAIASVLTVQTTIMDMFAKITKAKKVVFNSIACLIMLALILPLCFNGGLYLIIILERYSIDWSRYYIVVIYYLVLIFSYRLSRIVEDILLMIGAQYPKKLLPVFKYSLYFLWGFLVPVWVIITIILDILFFLIPTLDNSPSATWIKIIGWLYRLCPLAFLLFTSIFLLLKYTKQNGLKSAIKPTKFWGPFLLKFRAQVYHSSQFNLDPTQTGIDFYDLLDVKFHKKTSNA